MGYVDVAGVGHILPDGRILFADVSFRVGEGSNSPASSASARRGHP
jgi:hypothetical protein